MLTRSSTDSHASKFLLKKRTYSWAVSALGIALLAAFVKLLSGGRTALTAGLIATLYTGYVVFWSRIHPKIYLGKSISFIALIVSASIAYVSFSEMAHVWIWNRTFQLTESLAEYRDPVGNWSVKYPKLWSHQERRVSGTVLHTFKPSKIAPTMFFSITERPNVGTRDLELVVEGFFQNLPRDKNIEILQKGPITMPSGQEGYQLVYSEINRRIPLKNESLFVLDGTRLFYLTAAASPLWFDRQREYLERLLFSLDFSL